MRYIKNKNHIFTFFVSWIELRLSIFRVFHSLSYIQSPNLLLYQEDQTPYHLHNYFIFVYIFSNIKKTIVLLPNTKSIESNTIAEENNCLKHQDSGTN